MEKIKVLTVKIEELRSDLKDLVEGPRELVDPEVVRVSEALDKVLIQYYRVLGKKRHNVIRPNNRIESN
ncbi:MAG: Spo0E family sporulation regulatory protein-aspartic acid phosphatase [Caulobacteraceae bacterium]